MEIYYTTRVPGRTGQLASWSRAPGYPGWLAVALSPNAVGVFTEEGRSLDPSNEALIKNVRGSECAKMAWHPLLPLLAIGWKDGAISFWNAEERHMEEDSKIHRTVITSLAWNQSGDRLITADENGRLSMWKTDRLMRPIHVVSYDEAGCLIKQLVLGQTDVNQETRVTSTVVYYAATQGETATIKWANDQGYTGVVQEAGELVHMLIYYADKEQLLVVSASCTLSVLGKDDQLGTWQPISKMKFATGTGEAAAALQVTWLGNHTMASASEKDNVIRMYNFDTEDNYVLALDMPGSETGTGGLRITRLASDERFGLLAANTSDGRIIVYQYNAPAKDSEPVLDFAKCWEAQPAFSVGSKALQMEWGPNARLMVVVTEEGVHACRKTILHHKFRDGYVLLQSAVDRVLVENLDPTDGQVRPPGRVQTELQVLGLDISKGLLLLYDGNKCELYKVNERNEVAPGGGFETTSRAMAVNNDSIFRAADNRLEVCNLQGTVKQTLSFDENHGSPMMLDVSRDFLAAVTTNNIVRVFKVAGREAKPHAGPGPLIPSDVSASLRVDQMRVNGTGTMVAALVASKEASREPKLYVYCSDAQAPLVYDFGADKRLPQSLCWDKVEPKLLAVQTQRVHIDLDADQEEGPALEMALMFVSPDHGILMQEYQPLDQPGTVGCVGISSPHLILNKRPTGMGASAQSPFGASTIAKFLMQGFAGMQDADEKARRALLDFSYNLAVGNMDDAFRSIKAIKNPGVWENMAHLCIKNKRLDVAEHCLGNMEHARGARAAREAKNIEELDARVAMVAVHLGMLEDAKRLFISSDRYDLLNNLYCACGQWDKALEIAEKHDRIHLKSTHYAYAQHLEKVGDLKGALQHYEASGTQYVEVPRMYFEGGSLELLEEYITKHDHKDLTQWWARYLESRGELSKALDCYEKAGDSLSKVRIYCYSKNFAAAEEEISRNGDHAAAFHLARQYEAQSKVAEAIRYFTQAKRYSHGVRLAKSHDLDAELMNLALKSTPAVMVDTADYLNERGQYEKAATLYMKGGRMRKAVEMCFGAELFDVLEHITDDMNAGDMPDQGLFLRCTEFFMQHGQFAKAVKMLVAAKQYARALELCVEHDVAITEETAEAMTPDKSAMSTEERNGVLCRIAKVCKRQGAYQLAAKKYTQAGDKIKAMKALLRSGDTEKIVFFAGVSRQKDIYLMAANYLQTLDWHSNEELMKNIISFYSKAQAVEQLAAFYEACAQIEIDEYRDYEKALQAMQEACKHLQKSKAPDRDMRLASATQRIKVAQEFVRARQLITTQPQQALAACHELLSQMPQDAQQEQEVGVRTGDVYALLVEYWHEQHNAMEAYKLIEQMRRRNIILAPYLDQSMVDTIYKALGVEPVNDRRNAMGNGGYAGGAGDYVDEDVVEAADDDDDAQSPY